MTFTEKAISPEAWARISSTPLKVGEKQRPGDADRVVTDTASPYLVALVNKHMNDADAYAQLFADALVRRQAYGALIFAAGHVVLSGPPGPVRDQRVLVEREALDALAALLTSLGVDLAELRRQALEVPGKPNGGDHGE